MRLPIPAEQLKKLLLDENLISSEKFDALLAEAERKNQDFLSVLVSEKVADANYLGNLISKTLGVPRVSFEQRKIDEMIVKELPEDIEERLRAPIKELHAEMMRHLDEPHRHTWKDYAFLLSLVGGVLAILAAPFVVLLVILVWIAHRM